MRNTLDRSRLAFFAAVLCVFVAATAKADDKTNYLTVKDIKAMTPRTVTFAKRLSEYSGFFTNADGTSFVVGDMRGEQWVWHFVGALREGRTYRFPDVFTNYLAAPYYVTAKEIEGMAPCTATIASRSPCSSVFVTTDGKWFGIGDPGSGAEISHFIWLLKDGETNQFPKAFLDYRTAPRYVTARDITEMTPRTATLIRQWEGFSYFKTADGKGFFIGSQRDDKETEKTVDRFLRTLEEDKTYQFPDVFLKH